MWRMRYGESAGNYFIHKAGVINPVLKTLGTNKQEQRIIATQIIQALNMNLKNKK